MMGIEDSYTAFCFDEACAYFEGMVQKGESPRYKRKVKSMKEFYREVGGDSIGN